MEHEHRWRQTSKVFALVCECGVVCHEHLTVEIEKLRASRGTASNRELRDQLEEVRRENAILREELDVARQQLENTLASRTG